MVGLLSDAVETSQNQMEDVSQEALVSAFDEETQAAQDKKEEAAVPKDSLKEAKEALTFAKDSSNQKSPKETEKVTFKDIVQTSVANENSDVKMASDAKEASETLHAEHSCSKSDTTKSVKAATKDSVSVTGEERQITNEKEATSAKGIKRSLEEDTEGPAESMEIDEGRGKRPRKSEVAIESSPQPQVKKERQETAQEEEAEPMETETTRDLEPNNDIKIPKREESEEVGKGDDGEDGEGDDAGEDDVEKKDNIGQEKDKDDSKEDEESSTPSRKRKKKKRSYERPRGEGGKFMKEKPGTV